MAQDRAPIVIEKQGSFAVGGTVVRTPGTYNNNKPTAAGAESPRRSSLRLLSGAAELQDTADRHAAWRISVRAKLGDDARTDARASRPCFCVEVTRSISSISRVEAARATAPLPRPSSRHPLISSSSTSSGSAVWPDYFDGVQFDRKPETLNQFFRSVTPNTGPYDAGVIAEAMSALFDQDRPRHPVHAFPSWRTWWLTAIKSNNVKAIVAFEPGSGFVFPEGELPAAMPSAAGTLSPEAVPLGRLPEAHPHPDRHLLRRQHSDRTDYGASGEDNWRVRLAMARLWVDAINKHGGDAQLVHLPSSAFAATPTSCSRT